MTEPYILHALSPLQVGTGQAADIIDLPIARQRATNIPIVPGSAIKGVLRDTRRDALEPHVWTAVFGPETANASDHAGAFVAGDAQLLALPVRSFKGTFCWVTSPLLLRLANRDLDGALPNWPTPQSEQAAVSDAELLRGGTLYLEDLNLIAGATADPCTLALAGWVAGFVWPRSPEVMTKRFAVVDDETMSFLMETATQLDTRVRIKNETRTVASGALWIEESLPPETVLVGLMLADRSRKQDQSLTPAKVMEHAVPAGGLTAQFGGKATVGRGRCRLVPVDRPAAPTQEA